MDRRAHHIKSWCSSLPAVQAPSKPGWHRVPGSLVFVLPRVCSVVAFSCCSYAVIFMGLHTLTVYVV